MEWKAGDGSEVEPSGEQRIREDRKASDRTGKAGLDSRGLERSGRDSRGNDRRGRIGLEWRQRTGAKRSVEAGVDGMDESGAYARG